MHIFKHSISKSDKNLQNHKYCCNLKYDWYVGFEIFAYIIIFYVYEYIFKTFRLIVWYCLF